MFNFKIIHFYKFPNTCVFCICQIFKIAWNLGNYISLMCSCYCNDVKPQAKHITQH